MPVFRNTGTEMDTGSEIFIDLLKHNQRQSYRELGRLFEKTLSNDSDAVSTFRRALTFGRKKTSNVEVPFIAILPGGVDVTRFGDITHKSTNTTIIFKGCPIPSFTSSEYVKKKRGLYKSTVTLAQGYGNAFYHFLTGDLLRIAPVLDRLLLRHKQDFLSSSKIQIVLRAKVYLEALQILGIEQSRVVSGPLETETLIIPPPGSTGCGNPSLPLLRHTRKILREKLFKAPQSLHFYEDDSSKEILNMKTFHVLVLRRHASRKLSDNGFMKLVNAVRKGVNGKLNILIVDDKKNASISLYEQFRLFAKAILVIGLHSGSLAKIIVMLPNNSGVVELLPTSNDIGGETIRINYVSLAEKLGLRYHGILLTSLENWKACDSKYHEISQSIANAVTESVSEMIQYK
eukprot:g1192.t1